MTIIDPPWRLDPFQNIRDIRWGSSLLAAVAGYHGSTFSSIYVAFIRSIAPLAFSNLQLAFSPGVGDDDVINNLAMEFRRYTTVQRSGHTSPLSPLSAFFDGATGAPVASIPPIVPPQVPPGTKIFTDSAGSVYVTSTTMAKYALNGSQIWLLTEADSFDLTVGAVTIGYAAGHPDDIVVNEGGFTQVWDQSGVAGDSFSFGPPGTPQSVDVADDGSNYFVNETSVQKFDKFGVHAWTAGLPGLVTFFEPLKVAVAFGNDILIPAKNDLAFPATTYYMLALSGADGSLKSSVQWGLTDPNIPSIGATALMARKQRYPIGP